MQARILAPCMRLSLPVLLAATLAGCASAPDPGPAPAATVAPTADAGLAQDASADAWFRAGALSAHQRRGAARPARNLILFLGDGMSLTTVAAARILEGQRRGLAGEENLLSFERFPYTALSRTYNTDSQVPDSAGTMTALVTGVKTGIGRTSVGPSARRGDCAAARGAELATLLELSEAAGLSTGIVTTARLTHATPGATYAHSSERNWENDTDLSDTARQEGCRDIARQFVEFPAGDGIEVAFGGGRAGFLPATQADPEYPDRRGWRTDGRDLVQAWQQRHPEGRVIWNAAQFAALDPARSPRVLGLFEPDHMQYEHERRRDAGGEPSLAQMTATAIRMLDRNDRGYFLMVESGRIDHAHHAGNAFRALDETVAFAEAVRVAQVLAGDDTLVVVTADHSHTLGFAGYPKRGNPILGKVVGRSTEDHPEGDLARNALGLPYTTLSYANGPGYPGATANQPEGPKRFPSVPRDVRQASAWPDLGAVDTEDPDFLQPAAFPMRSETHAGDDVGVWATGPGSDAVRGSIEQNVVFHLMLQAQPQLVALLCRLGDCEQGVPLRRPGLEAVLSGRR
jgi:alkaline phosphatase